MIKQMETYPSVVSILICHSNDNIRSMLEEFLQENSFTVKSAYSFESAKEKLRKTQFDLLLLEIDNQTGKGLDTISYLRETEDDIIIVCLSSDNDTTMLKEAYSRGCDDYIIPPLSMSILVWHIKAFLRRRYPSHNTDKIIKIGNAVFDPLKQTFNGHHINLKLGLILQILSEHQNQLVEKKMILAKVWKRSDFYSARSLSVYMLNLRKLLQPHGFKIVTYNKIGYKLVSPP